MEKDKISYGCFSCIWTNPICLQFVCAGWGDQSQTNFIFSTYRPSYLIEAYVSPENYWLFVLGFWLSIYSMRRLFCHGDLLEMGLWNTECLQFTLFLGIQLLLTLILSKASGRCSRCNRKTTSAAITVHHTKIGGFFSLHRNSKR